VAIADSAGSVTVPAVLVTDNGARVTVFAVGTGVPRAEPGPEISLRVFPNPARDLPNLHIALARDANVRIEVVDVTGRRVAESALLALKQGAHVVTPEGAGLRSMETHAQGVYFYRLTCDGGGGREEARSGRWVLMR
jgi:hypothetical protein